MAKEIITVRVDPKDKETLLRFAELLNCTPSDALRGYLPGERWAEVLTEDLRRMVQSNPGKDITARDAWQALAAEGLRNRMLTSTPKVHPNFLFGLTPDGIVHDYLQWSEAMTEHAKMLNSDGSKPRYHFDQIPAGGKWEAKGMAGAFGVLPINEYFTVNGIERPGGEIPDTFGVV